MSFKFNVTFIDLQHLYNHSVASRCSVKKVFLEFSQNSQKKHLC